MHKRASIFISFTLLFCSVSFSQIEYDRGGIRGEIPDSWYELLLDKTLLNDLASVTQKKDDAFQFAIPVPVELNPLNSGIVVNQGNEKIWILGIRSEGARSLNLILEPFILPEGAYVYIYDSAKTTLRGAFTSDNNLSSSLLPTMPVPGEELILECHFPGTSVMAGAIGVSQVAHDYIGILSNEGAKDGRYGLSQACNIDINCNQGASFTDIKRSVCRLIVNGIELCTGVLINNTNQQNIPYLLTAQHCIGTKSDAAKSIFVFGYESPWCDGPDGGVSHSLSGSSLKATNEVIDFTLVQLSVFPPLVYKPFLAGWDISGQVPTNTIAIHHPQGDVKKISVDNNPPVISTFGSFSSNGFWKVLQWDAGTTEPGSSGCPLFDQNKRVTGLLTGGDAICGRSVNDYFARLSVSYNLSADVTKHLRSWIDPAQSGFSVLNGRDPYAANYLTNDTLNNIFATETLSAKTYVLPGTGYATGFNSDSITGYAEYFKNDEVREITEVWLNIAKAAYVTNTDSIRIFVYDDGIKPGRVLASKRIFIKEAGNSYTMKIDFDRTVPVTGNFFIGWKLFYRTKAKTESRQFAVFHSPNRLTPALNSAWLYRNGSWESFNSHPFMAGSFSLDVDVILTGYSVADKITVYSEPESDFRIFPNPSAEFIVISSDSEYQYLKAELFNYSGKKVISLNLENEFPGQHLINISSLNNGIYYLIIGSRDREEVVKILKIK